MIRQHPLVAAVIALALGWTGAAGAHGDDMSRVMGSISVGAGEHAGDLSTVNGSIHVGANAAVGSAHTVNGSIALDQHATAASLTTVNGSVRLADAARVTGSAHTVNGSMSLADGAGIAARLSNVNGVIRLAAAHVGGDIETVTGDVGIGANARVDGGIHVHRESGSSEYRSRGLQRIEIGPGAVVKGTLRFDRPVKLYVSDRATIGQVEGATPIRFPGDRPTGDQPQ